jgi:hypothetical protein
MITLKSKLFDVIVVGRGHAAMCAYAILFIGDFERLHNWTENLKNWFEWLPDGLVIRGEHLTLTGDHQRAPRESIEVGSREIPIFNVGLSMIVERLKLYVDAEGEFGSGDIGRAKQLLDDLVPLCSFADWRKPTVTLRNPDFLATTEPTPETSKTLAPIPSTQRTLGAARMSSTSSIQPCAREAKARG